MNEYTGARLARAPRPRQARWAWLAALLCACGPSAPPPLENPVSSEELASAQDDLGQWLHYGRNYASWRYFPGDQVNAANAGALELQWKIKIPGDGAGFEATPLFREGRLYMTFPEGHLACLDARTGRQIWLREQKLPEDLTMWPGRINRGAAIADKRLYLGRGDAHLLCLDAETGEELWDRRVADCREGYNITSAPLVVKDCVITGVAGSEYGARGFIMACDLQTGRLRWKFEVVPEPGQPGNETWKGDSWKHGGGAPWLTGSYDPELDLLYWGTGNPAPDFNGEVRAGDNLFTNCILALDPDDGRLVWQFQTTPNDVYDWGAVNELILIDGEFGGAPVKALVQANRNGYLYVLDRADGRFIRATPYTRVNWAIERPGLPPAHNPEIHGQSGVEVWPGNVGGKNWPPAAYNPRAGMIYIPTIERSTAYFPGEAEYRRGLYYLGGVPKMSETPAEGRLAAVDLASGEIRWSFDAKGPNWGGALATGGGLVFAGTFDGFFRAFDEKTGAVLWEYKLDTPAYSGPVAFMLGGRQMLGVAAGFGFIGSSTSGHPPPPPGGYYYVFALPEAKIAGQGGGT